MSPDMVNVKAVNVSESWKYMVNALHFGENKRSHPQDIESGDSYGTQPVVVLLLRLTVKDFTFRYVKCLYTQHRCDRRKAFAV
jgi:hypothetical protein